MERSFVMIKPDGVDRGLIGEVITRLEKKGFKMIAGHFMRVHDDLAKKHYDELKERPFFGDLVSFITSSPVFAMVWEGPNCIKLIRQLVGKTRPDDAEQGSVRGDFANITTNNLIHASDSPGAAEREINLWFDRSELVTWKQSVERWWV